jgi:N-acyl-D-aspartate/D-glutamate deacylase
MFDLILENADVMDGSGKQSYKADIGIKGAAIEKIGDLKDAGAAKRVDVSGKMVCPGFIDVHSHADLTFFREDHPRLLSPLVRQGITTFVGGNCGMALAPITEEHRDGQQMYLEVFTQMDFEKDIHWDTMGSFMEYMDKDGVLLNAALLAPHGMMRISAMGLELGLAGKEDISYMTRSLEESLEAGAFGLSTGLQYPPGSQSDTPELVELAKPLNRYGGIFTSHLRSYTNATLPQAIDEVAEVAQKNDIPGQVSHIFSLPWLGRIHKPALAGLKWLANHASFASKVVPDPLVFGEMTKILKQLDSLRGKGVKIGMDVMPTTAGFTHLMAFFPMWALTGGREQVLARISDKKIRKEILEDIEKGEPTWPHRGKNDWSLNIMKQLGWDAVTVMAVHSEKNKPLEGRRFTDIAEEQGKHTFDAMCDLLLEEDGKVLVFESLSEPDDLFTEKYTFPALQDPETMITTDTILLGMGKPSYLFYGCYPKFIHRYVYEKGLVDLPSAVARCTSLPARWFGIENRGLVKEGYFADLLVMRPEQFSTKAVFRDPENFPEGLDMVIINGKVVQDEEGIHPEMRPGMVLRKQQQSVPRG